MKEQRKRGKLKFSLITTIVILAILAMIAIGYFLLHSFEVVSIDEPVYFYVGETKSSFADGIMLKHSDKGTEMISGHEHQRMPGIMLYYEDRQATLLQESMLWISQSLDNQQCISYYSEVSLENGIAMIQDGAEEYRKAEGFLFNGSDTYLLLEETELTYNGETVKLSPLSTVEVSYNNEIQIYDYENQKGYLEEIDDTEIYLNFSNGIKVNAATDSLQLKNGSWYLLLNDPESLNAGLTS